MSAAYPITVDIAARRSAPFTADTLEGRPVPPFEWHVPGLAPARNVTLISADGGTGKTTVALQLCASTALGRNWLGQSVRKGRALYLSAEEEGDELHRRLDAMMPLDASFSDLGDLKLWPLAEEDAVLVAPDRGGRLEETARWAEFAEMAMDWAPRLIVLDAAADVYGGNESDRPSVRQFVGKLRGVAMKTGAAVVLLSHPSLTGLASGSGSSGSTAWSNSVRSRIYMTRPSPETDRDLAVLSVKKANYAPAGTELRLRLQGGMFVNEDQGGFAGMDQTIARNRVDRLFLEMLAAYDAQGRVVSDRAGANYAPKMFADDALAAGTTKAAFKSAMDRLFHAGELRQVEIGPASRRLRKIVRADANG